MARAPTLALALVLGLGCLTAVRATGYVPPQCRPPPNPKYGGHYSGHYQSYELGTVINYYCEQGYELHGRSWTVCILGNQGPYWLYPPPICRRKVDCGSLSNPRGGRVRLTGTSVGSRAEYSCNKGFILVGFRSRQCRPNGQWSGKAPTCRPQQCEQLRDIANGRVSVSGVIIGSTATYTCNKGYFLVGSSTRRCQTNAEWSGEEPFCKLIECDRLRDIANGQVQLSGTAVGSTATYSCNRGYILVGKSTRVCQSNGEWSGREPFCKLIECDRLQDIRYGRVVLSGRTVGSTATYNCDKGFVLVGDFTRVCQRNGEWFGREPFCEAIQCPQLPDILNGRVVLTGTTVASTATYSCDKGYDLVGISTRTCLVNGQWSGKEPFCRLIECDRLQDIRNGRVVLTGTTVGSTATYSCFKGYLLVGEQTRTCRIGGVWSGQEPFCQLIECERLLDIRNGRVVLTGTTVGSTATYSCNKGYILLGDNTRVCQSGGQWSGREPFCKRIECDPLRDIRNGRVVLTGTTVDSTATYSCNKGYILVGEQTRTCQVSGVWTGREPFCRLIECDRLRDIINGRVTVSGTIVGSTATYTCVKGYVLVGDSTRTCQATGQWSGREPFCETVNCEKLGNPVFGSVFVTGITVGSVATYSCQKGYILVGDRTRRCQPGGQWSGSAPFCKIVDCGRLADPDNGRVQFSVTTFGSVATYTCTKGYIIFGLVTRACQSNGRWSGEAPVCKVVDCGNLPNPRYGKVELTGTSFGSTAFYTCQDGFFLVGDRSRTCQLSGDWSGQVPVCEPIECDRLFDIPNGRVVLRGTRVGSTATYSCNSGYLLIGKSTRRCQSNGEWSGEEPSCKLIECEQLEGIANGRVELTGTTVGSRATYSCDSGYLLVGEVSRTCQSSGTWSGNEPFCKIIDCGSVQNPRFGQVTLTGTTFGSTATYSCQKGYILVGKSTRTCQANRQWSGVAPVCKIVSCGSLDSPQSGRVVLTGTSFGSTATYSCFRGYILVGEQTRTCQANGQWSGVAARCKIIDCRPLEDPKFGNVQFSTTTFGSIATYYCQKGYILVGRSTRVCQRNGQWSGSAPTCEAVDCGQLRDPQYGRVSLTSTTVGSTATYSCDKGFVLVGESSRTCQSNGQWSGVAPFCRPLDCGFLRNPQFGKVVLTGTSPGSTATYSCFKGYLLVGEETRTCQANGQWSGTELTCNIVDCGRNLEAPKNGFVHIPCTTLDCTATYWCRSGYTLIRDNSRTCQANGYWSNDTPTCQRDYY